MTTVLDKTRVPPAGPGNGSNAMARPKVVSVNGITIPRSEIARETQHHPAGKPLDAWFAAARALVVRQLLLQEAQHLGVRSEPMTDGDGRRETDEDAVIRLLLEREVVTPEPDEASCRRVYEAQRHRFRSSPLYAVRHILIAAPPDDDAARADARSRCEALLQTLAFDISEFSRLAAASSDCPSRSNGGALGQISHGQTVQEFEAALADASVGSLIPRPVETRYGFHAVIVDQCIEGRQLPFEIVRSAIADWLAARTRHVATRQYIAVLAGRSTITGIDLGVGASPLVQ